MALSSKQNQFAAEYTVDFNATAAAIRAGYSEKTAAQAGHNLLQKPEILKAVEEIMADRQKRTLITGDKVLKEIARIAFADVSDYAQVVALPSKRKGGPAIAAVSLTPTDKLTADQKAAIAVIEETQSGIKVRTHDKVKALELLCKHLGLLTEKVSISGITPEMVAEVEALVNDAATGD